VVDEDVVKQRLQDNRQKKANQSNGPCNYASCDGVFERPANLKQIRQQDQSASGQQNDTYQNASAFEPKKPTAKASGT